MIRNLHRTVRYRILRTLHLSFPVPLNERNLCLDIMPLFPGVLQSDITAEIVYLQQDPYLSSKLVKAMGEEMWVHGITNKGIKLLEGTSPPDPAIDLPEPG